MKLKSFGRMIVILPIHCDNGISDIISERKHCEKFDHSCYFEEILILPKTICAVVLEEKDLVFKPVKSVVNK